jgi:hypothetical protein
MFEGGDNGVRVGKRLPQSRKSLPIFPETRYLF